MRQICYTTLRHHNILPYGHIFVTFSLGLMGEPVRLSMSLRPITSLRDAMHLPSPLGPVSEPGLYHVSSLRCTRPREIKSLCIFMGPILLQHLGTILPWHIFVPFSLGLMGEPVRLSMGLRPITSLRDAMHLPSPLGPISEPVLYHVSSLRCTIPREIKSLCIFETNFVHNT